MSPKRHDAAHKLNLPHKKTKKASCPVYCGHVKDLAHSKAASPVSKSDLKDASDHAGAIAQHCYGLSAVLF